MMAGSLMVGNLLGLVVMVAAYTVYRLCKHPGDGGGV